MHVCMGLLLAGQVQAADTSWTLNETSNPDGPGRVIMITHDQQAVAGLVFGQGQMKSFLNVYGVNEERLTNPGLNAGGKPTGQFPHHRGIFIGWKTASELGTWDLWHMDKGGGIRVAEVELKEATSDGVHLVTRNEWFAGKEDASGSSLLMTEWRDMRISRPAPGQTQIDLEFRLRPERDLRLAGDLQHSGVHFRAANEVATRSKETSYLQEPPGRAKGGDLKWCQLLFPIGDQWYAATQMNAADNPVEELSTRDYGRFGYFFKRELKKGDTLPLHYRFLVQAVEAPAANPKRSSGQDAQARQAAQTAYEEYTASLPH